ncbi:glycosyltransferase family 2 protein [Butyrivibrio proteoclasticus]|nr:glycosyltransferase family 2 protein [Butyrivibrio proteoclasticus]
MSDKNIEFDYLKGYGDIHKYDQVRSKCLWGKHPKQPMFSIYIPTYKRLKLLKLSLKSAMEQQEFDNYEIVIVDNDNDETDCEVLEYIETLNCPRVVYYKNEKNIGIYGNTLRGATLSHGKYVALLNDDDLLHPYYLYVMSSFINRYGYFGVVGSIPHEFREDNFRFPSLPRGIYAYKVSNYEFFFGCSVTSPGLLYPRALIQDIYNAHEELLMGDQIIQYKGLVKCGLYFICFPISAYRIQNNATLKNDVLKQMMIHMCGFKKQISQDDAYLKMFMKFFRKEYFNWYISSSTDFWKKKSIKNEILNSVGIKKDISDSLKSMVVRTIIHKVHEHYGILRGNEHDTLIIPDRIVIESKKY